jgi:UDP-glucuronate 4-epimerase
VTSRVLVTGVAGFIGMPMARALLARGATVVGVDNFDPYYDVGLKEARLATLADQAGFAFQRVDLADAAATAALFRDGRFTHVVHLAAQPGVRYSLENPAAYLRNNIDAFGCVLEGCRHAHVAHLVYASSSSVYGANHTLPFSEDQRVDQPVSLYAATKRANELMAHSYSHLFQLPATGLRFFTVYGPWGRPDMALFLFTKAILEGRAIDVFNYGDMKRDFTYVDDIVEGVIRVLDRVAVANPAYDPALADPATSNVPYRVFNIGNNNPVALLDFIGCIEDALGKKAEKRLLPLQDGDVPATYANTDALNEWVGFVPGTSVQHGIERFVAWYRDYYRI